MNRIWLGHTVGVVALVAGLAGCSGSASPDSPGGGATSSAVQQISTQGLPKLADPLPPLDEGRLTLYIPTGWNLAPRSNKFLARFVDGPGGAYPSIIVTAEDYGSTFDVTPKNVETFAKDLAAEYAADKSTASLARGIAPIRVGSFVGIQTQRRTQAKMGYKMDTVEQVLLETVVDGRKYRVELRARDGEAEQSLPALLATAGGMKFGQDGAGPADASDMAAVDEEPPALIAEPEKPTVEAKPAAASPSPAAREPAPKSEAKPAAKPAKKADKPVAPKKDSAFEIIDDEEL